MSYYVSQAQAQYDDAAQKNKENADAYKKSVGETFDIQGEQAKKQAEYDKQQLDGQYKGLYDEAALQQLVNEREIERRQASLGLTDSGLTASQQTAIQVSRGNADAKISAQKQAAIDSITLQLEQYLAQIEQNRANSFAEIDYNLNNTNTNLYNSLMSQAYSNQAAANAAAKTATSGGKSNENTYYNRAKYLLENSGEDAANRYIASLNIDHDTRFSLAQSLGISGYVSGTSATNSSAVARAAVDALKLTRKNNHMP